MESFEMGDLVTVTGGASGHDGIVFETPSRTKVVVVVVDPNRGPVFRTVNPNDLSRREDAGGADPVMRAFMRRRSHVGRGAGPGAGAAGKGAAGFTRGAAHRPTGR